MALLGDEYASSDEDSSFQNRNGDKPSVATEFIAAPEVSIDVWSYPSPKLGSNTNIT